MDKVTEIFEREKKKARWQGFVVGLVVGLLAGWLI